MRIADNHKSSLTFKDIKKMIEIILFYFSDIHDDPEVSIQVSVHESHDEKIVHLYLFQKRTISS